MNMADINEHLDNKKPIIIIIGNEKGGAGKTTTTMHLMASLLCLGFNVASIDVDIRQRSLTRYIENRENSAKSHNVKLALPQHFVIPMSRVSTQEQRDEEEIKLFNDAIERAQDKDFIIIDTPGNNTKLSSLAHSIADQIITPLNDSFIDLDVISKVKEDLNIDKPSHYAQMVWQYKMQKAAKTQQTIDWVILRNRLSNIDAINKRNMHQVLEKLSQRLGFRYIDGFSERVVFRELFLQGLTLLDLKLFNIDLKTSHIAARQELRFFLKSLKIKKITHALKGSDLMFKLKQPEEVA